MWKQGCFGNLLACAVVRSIGNSKEAEPSEIPTQMVLSDWSLGAFPRQASENTEVVLGPLCPCTRACCPSLPYHIHTMDSVPVLDLCPHCAEHWE